MKADPLKLACSPATALLAIHCTSLRAADNPRAIFITLYALGSYQPSANASHLIGHWKILREKALADRRELQAARQLLFDSLRANTGLAARYFFPHHAAQICQGQHTTVYIICFFCHRAQVLLDDMEVVGDEENLIFC